MNNQAKPSRKYGHKYHPKKVVDIYALAREGKSDKEICATIGVSHSVLALWSKKYEEVRYALERARNSKSKPGEVETFREYVYRKLHPDLQKLWDQIELWSEHPDGITRVEQLVTGQSRKVQQSLFMHAVVCSSFNSSKALSKLGMSSATLLKWKNEDPDFPRLLDELQFHKKNFFEEGLVRLVRYGDTAATVFANKTLNKDRGYSEKIEVEHSGNVQVGITVSIDELKLPLETRKQILLAIRQMKPAVAVEPPRTVHTETHTKLLELLGGDEEDQQTERRSA